MRRWNGWGDETVTAAVPPGALRFLADRIGPGTPPRDAALREVLAAVPASRLPEDARFRDDPRTRLLHARGQSLPDWIALRSGRPGPFPDAVAFPESDEDVRGLLRRARELGARVIPYGGGTSVAGHVNPPPGDAPVLTVDLSRMSLLKSLDGRSHLATFGAGVTGPDLEAALRAHGFTLGHFPQSFELSTLGGWVATRSSGQQSLRYGRIERLFAGGRLESPAGSLVLPPFPASAAGPDLKELLLGSEGRLGILTEATVRVTKVPAREEFLAFFFRDRAKALDAARELAQARLPLSLLRLAGPEETATTLRMAGRERPVALLESYLGLRRIKGPKCLLLVGVTGRERHVRAGRREALALARLRGGLFVGKALGRGWQKERFRAPYLRNALWDSGYAVDTLETAAPWSAVPALQAGIEGALRNALSAAGERVHVFSHLSHLYPDGSSVYTTFLFRLASDSDANLTRWRLLKEAGCAAIVAGGGTISHQHGVGADHRRWLEAEKGALGLSTLAALARQFDPEGMMNPGKLLP